MKIAISVFLILLAFGFSSAQSEKKNIRNGNSQYKSQSFEKAEIEYRKGLEKNKSSLQATYNLGDALYKQNKYEEAAGQFQSIVDNEKADESLKAKAYYNLGNTLLKSKKLEESVEAYKNTLKRMPNDNDAKYNLAYARALMKKEEEQKKQNKDNKDDKDKKDNKENKDKKDKKDDKDNKENKDKKDDKNKDKDKGDKEEKDKDKGKENEEKKDEKGEDKKDKDQQARKPQQISKEDAERLLNALNQKEAEKQKKLNQKESSSITIEKQW